MNNGGVDAKHDGNPDPGAGEPWAGSGDGDEDRQGSHSSVRHRSNTRLSGIDP